MLCKRCFEILPTFASRLKAKELRPISTFWTIAVRVESIKVGVLPESMSWHEISQKSSATHFLLPSGHHPAPPPHTPMTTLCPSTISTTTTCPGTRHPRPGECEAPSEKTPCRMIILQVPDAPSGTNPRLLASRHEAHSLSVRVRSPRRPVANFAPWGAGQNRWESYFKQFMLWGRNIKLLPRKNFQKITSKILPSFIN